MKKILLVSLCLGLSVALVASLAIAKDVGVGRYSTYKPERSLSSTISLDQNMNQLNAAAAQGTTFLASYDFDASGSCVEEGWTHVDITSQTAISPGTGGALFHIENFVGMGGNYQGNVGVLIGSQTLWCGARATTTNPLCGYASLPGYGNSWNQAFCTKVCVATGAGASISFEADWDSEPGYDATTLEISNCTGSVSDENWITIAGGVGDWDGNLDSYSTDGDTTISVAIADSLHGAGGANSLKVRIHFVADGGWSDSDGLWDTDGAVAIDNLTLSTLATETFEAPDVVGALSTTDWENCTPAGYGDNAALVSMLADNVEQNLPYQCGPNLTCVWSFYAASTADYGCGGFGAQTAVPYENLVGQYINNEVWSPEITLSGTGVQFELAFDSYRDLNIDPLIFYVWHVQSKVGGCGGQWQDRNFVYYGPDRDWLRVVQPFGDLVEMGATDLRVALGVVDMCPFWCGSVGTGLCHSHAPLLDNVDVYRIEAEGPQFATRDLEFFQDTFAADGTTTGTARMDMANDILPAGNLNFHSGDSMTVTVSDPEVGLDTDPFTSFGAAVYAYFQVDRDPSLGAGPAPSAYSDDPRYPVVDDFVSGGETWVCIRMDTSFTNGAARTGAQPDKFAVDLNDDLFVPGDTISFVFSATNTGAVTTYWSAFTGATTVLADVLANPNETTILPAAGWQRGGDILYVDGMDGRGAQPFFDTAFQMIGIYDQIDRYDIRAPSSGVANRPGSRVVDVFQQLLPCYRKIIWNTGNLDNGNIGDASTTGEKSDDAGMLLTFLDNLSLPGGVYFSGDNIAEEWPSLVNSAIPLRDTYIQHTLVDPDHLALIGQSSPLVIGEPGSCFDHFTGPDTLIAYGGCALYNNFDVLAPVTSVSTQEMRYDGGTAGSDGAVIAQYTENVDSVTVGVVLSGFSYHYATDMTEGGAGFVPARVHHLRDILVWLGNSPPVPTAATPTYRNTLSQNYPNPFNPQTTIEFTLKDLAPVSVKIYNVRGQLVRTLVDETRAPGITHTVTWDGQNNSGQQVSSGVYFYKLVTKSFTQTKKMVLLK